MQQICATLLNYKLRTHAALTLVISSRMEQIVRHIPFVAAAVSKKLCLQPQTPQQMSSLSHSRAVIETRLQPAPAYSLSA